MNESMLAYVAGFFDAEGTVGVYRRAGYFAHRAKGYRIRAQSERVDNLMSQEGRMLTWAVAYAVIYGNASDGFFIPSIAADIMIVLFFVAGLSAWIKTRSEK